MNPHNPKQPESETLARVDRLINTAMDAEAANDFDGANIAWAKIAAMDDASRRSAASLQAGLESLRAPTQTPDVSAKVLARLGMKVPAKRNEAKTDAVRVDNTPTPVRSTHNHPTSRGHKTASHRTRKWYSMSPVLASFVLGGLASLGLVIAHEYTNPAPQQETAIVVVPQPVFAQSAQPNELLPPPVASASHIPSLRMGDTSQYDHALAPAQTSVASASVQQGYWWRGPASQYVPTVAQERWWINTNASENLAPEPTGTAAGQVLLNEHGHQVDLFQLLLGERSEKVETTDTSKKPTQPKSR